MQRILLTLAIGLMSFALTILSAQGAESNNQIKIDSGLLQGAPNSDGSVRMFKGIPFAAPPVGDLRWKAPQPPAAWHGVRNANDFGRHTNVQFLGNLSHAVADNVTGYFELWGQANNDPAKPNRQASLDLSLAWLVWKKSPSLQFDVGANIGLTPETPRLQLYVGVSQKF